MLKRLLFGLIAALAVAPSLGAAQAVQTPPVAASDRIPIDPSVRQGLLPNGFRYAILRNARPIGGVSMRLRFDVGSYEEDAADGGVAHFLEHMAFNGTRSFPEGELIRRFADAGVAFGRDQNASTSAFATTYQLDLPVADETRLDLAFAWMRDIGDGLLFQPEAVERERGVVMAEHDAGLGAAKDRYEAYQAFMAPTLRSRVRSPIGTRETLRAIDAEALSDFHRRWYRPDNAVLVVVGDLPADALEARVRAAFADWTPPAEPMRRAEATGPDLTRPLDVLVRTDPTLASSVNACRLAPFMTRGPDSVSRRRFQITRGLWLATLNRRLQRLGQGSDAPFTNAFMSFSPWTREADAFCLYVTPRSDDLWGRGLTAALTEVRRLEAHGVTQAEIDRVVTTTKASNASQIASAGDRYSTTLAQQLLAAMPLHGLDAAGFVAPAEVPGLYDPIVAAITPVDVAAAFRADWSGSEPLIAAVMASPPDAGAVRAAWAEIAAAPPPPADAAPEISPWAYADFGPPGAIVSRETVETPGFTRVRFDNGVVLNLKTVRFTRDLVQVAVRFGAGRREVADADLFAAQIGGSMLALGGFGKHRFQELTDLFPGRRFGTELSVGDDAFGLSGTTRPADLELQLQVMAATFSDPGFRDDFSALLPTMFDSLYRNYRSQPGQVLSQAMIDALAPGAPLSLPPRETTALIGADDFARIFRPALTEAPLEVTVVGDVEEDEAIRLVAATLGTLPRRAETARARGDTWFMRFPETATPIRAVHEGSVDQALIRLMWPLYVADPSGRREQRALALLRGIVGEAVRDEVREALGASYSPQAGLNLPDDADQGEFSVTVATSPQAADAVATAVRRVVADLAGGGVTQGALDAVRTPILDRIDDNRRTNSWWIGALNGSARDPQVIRDALEWEADYRAMTVAEVQAVAARWLSGPPIEATALPPPVIAPIAESGAGAGTEAGAAQP